MRNLTILLVAICFVSCIHDNTIIDENPMDEIFFLSCEPVFDDGNYFTSCKDILDTSGLKLYPFIPFTDEEWRFMSYDYKLERRQVPKDFLRDMTTKELFYQVVFCDLSHSMILYNSTQYGFEATKKQLNILSEILNRPDVGHVLLELLQNVNPSIIKYELSKDCWWWFFCLQIIGAQEAVINNMTDEDICAYVHHQLRCYDIMQSLDDYHPSDASLLSYGLGNVMIRYEFEPFLNTLTRRNPITNELIWDTQRIDEKGILQVIDYVKQFIKTD